MSRVKRSCRFGVNHPVRHYYGPIFLPHVANAIGHDEPPSSVQMGQAPPAFVSGRLTAAMVGRGLQPATRYSTALSRSRLLDHGRLQWIQVDCVGPLSPLLTAKAP